MANVIGNLFGNIADHFKHNTLMGKVVCEGKPLDKALGESICEKTVIGRMATKNENIFEAAVNTSRATGSGLTLLFGTADKPKEEEGNIA